MKQSTNMKDVQLPMLLPGVTFTTSSNDYRLVESMRLLRFDGTRWVPFSDLIKIQ